MIGAFVFSELWVDHHVVAAARGGRGRGACRRRSARLTEVALDPPAARPAAVERHGRHAGGRVADPRLRQPPLRAVPAVPAAARRAARACASAGVTVAPEPAGDPRRRPGRCWSGSARCTASARSACACGPPRSTRSPPASSASTPSATSVATWALAGGLAGLSGILIAPSVAFSVFFMTTLLLRSVAAALVGGLTSIGGRVHRRASCSASPRASSATCRR